MLSGWIWMHHRNRGIAWHRIDCPHFEIWHRHSNMENGWKIEGSDAKPDCTTEFVLSRGVKSTIHFLNSDTGKIWACRNLLDSSRFSKDSLLRVDWRSATQIKKLISPLRSLRNYEKNEYKVLCILNLGNFGLQGIWKIPSRFSSIGNLKIHYSKGKPNLTIVFPMEI